MIYFLFGEYFFELRVNCYIITNYFPIWGFYAKVSCRETFGFLPRNRWFLGRKLLKPMLP
jgi:hypothetical protein